MALQLFTTTETYSRYREFFHNNWGWDEDNDNGYYLADLFDPINDPDLPSNTRNYTFSNLEMWTNIYK
jgi:hypothetical protein